MSNNLLYWDVPKEIAFNIYQDILVHFTDLLQICSIQMVNKNEEDDRVAWGAYSHNTISYVHLVFGRVKNRIRPIENRYF